MAFVYPCDREDEAIKNRWGWYDLEDSESCNGNYQVIVNGRIKIFNRFSRTAFIDSLKHRRKSSPPPTPTTLFLIDARRSRGRQGSGNRRQEDKSWLLARDYAGLRSDWTEWGPNPKSIRRKEWGDEHRPGRVQFSLRLAIFHRRPEEK